MNRAEIEVAFHHIRGVSHLEWRDLPGGQAIVGICLKKWTWLTIGIWHVYVFNQARAFLDSIDVRDVLVEVW